MCRLMSLEFAVILKIFGALLTVVDRGHNRMRNFLVFDKLMFLIERLIALLAGKPLLLAVHPFVVTFQIVKVTDFH